MGRLLQDPYANYVIQSALMVTQGPLHAAVVDAIRPHINQLRSTPHGKRIISKINVKDLIRSSALARHASAPAAVPLVYLMSVPDKLCYGLRSGRGHTAQASPENRY